MKYFFHPFHHENIFCKGLLKSFALIHGKTGPAFTEARFILKLRHQFSELRAACVTIFFLFFCFQIGILKPWAGGQIGITVIFILKITYYK